MRASQRTGGRLGKSMDLPKRLKVATELRDVLVPAYPCASLEGACKDMRWQPALGLFPRGFTGATGDLTDVALVLVFAEPGEPPTGAKPQPDMKPAELIEVSSASVSKAFETSSGAFHGNVRYLLDRCWPAVPYAEQLRRTWMTEAVLCSAEVTTGPVPKVVEKECGSRFLRRQLELLPDAFVVALGGKANRRLKMCGRPADASVIAAGLPGEYSKKAKPSWDAAGIAFQRHLQIVR